MQRESIQANINLTREDHDKLAEMMESDGYILRSPFVRKLIRQEYSRRASKDNAEPELEKQSAPNLQPN